MNKDDLEKKTFVYALDSSDRTALRKILEERSWIFSELPYAEYRASSDHISVIAYKSGKTVIQGAAAKEFVEFTLEPRILKERSFSAGSRVSEEIDFRPHAGLDESGKGDFFGPLVIACVYVGSESLEKKLESAGVKDSKLIKNDAAITRISSDIRRIVDGRLSVIVIGPEAYNRFYGNIKNLNRLLAWGHARALETLVEKVPECGRALADKFGDEALIRNAFAKYKRDIILEQRTKAESDTAVAAASIMARAEFVRRMKILSGECGMELPKGASAAVDSVAKSIALAGGARSLGKFAKMHFRTAYRALGLPEPERKNYVYPFKKND